MDIPKIPQNFQFTFIGPNVPRTAEEAMRVRDPKTGLLTDQTAELFEYSETVESSSNASSCSTSPSYTVQNSYEWRNGERWLIQRERWEWTDNNPFPVNGSMPMPPAPKQGKPPSPPSQQLQPPKI